MLLLKRHNEHSLTKYWSGRLGLMLAYYSVKCLSGSFIMLSIDKKDRSFKKRESWKSFFLECANLTNFIFGIFFFSFPLYAFEKKNIFYTDNVKILSLFLVFYLYRIQWRTKIDATFSWRHYHFLFFSKCHKSKTLIETWLKYSNENNNIIVHVPGCRRNLHLRHFSIN